MMTPARPPAPATIAPAAAPHDLPGHKSAPRALAILAVCFAASGLLRSTDVFADLAAARKPGTESAAQSESAPAKAPPKAQSTAPADASPPKAATCEPSLLLKSIRQREAQLATREIEIDDRTATLKAMEKNVGEKLARLVSTREKLQATLAIADGAAAKDVARLVAMYEKMKPKKAAAIFNKMADDFAAGMLAQMHSESASFILSNMDAGKAYAISVIIAGRNAAAPKT